MDISFCFNFSNFEYLKKMLIHIQQILNRIKLVYPILMLFIQKRDNKKKKETLRMLRNSFCNGFL